MYIYIILFHFYLFACCVGVVGIAGGGLFSFWKKGNTIVHSFMNVYGDMAFYFLDRGKTTLRKVRTHVRNSGNHRNASCLQSFSPLVREYPPSLR